jgi:hypothetical protein
VNKILNLIEKTKNTWDYIIDFTELIDHAQAGSLTDLIKKYKIGDEA